MRDVYAERIGHDRQVVERWLDIMRRSRPASPEMSQLKARIVEIVTNRKWVRKAIAQGWSEREVLGICPWAPLTRPDAQGVVVAIALQPRAGMSVTRVTEDRITFRRKRSSGRLVHYRWLAGIADSVPIWEAIVTGVADDREMAN
jgi:hypothetical protein